MTQKSKFVEAWDVGDGTPAILRIDRIISIYIPSGDREGGEVQVTVALNCGDDYTRWRLRGTIYSWSQFLRGLIASPYYPLDDVENMTVKQFNARLNRG